MEFNSQYNEEISVLRICMLTSTVLRSPVAVDLDNIHDIVAYENTNIITIHSIGTS